MHRTLTVLNELERAGLLRRYAIGGAIGALFYMDQFETEDQDVFILLGTEVNPLTPLAPLHAELERRGFRLDGPYVVIHGVPVQFLPTWNALVEEAVDEARAVSYESVSTRVLTAEHLAAIMVQTGRPKDRSRLLSLREQADLNGARLTDILTRHDLQERFTSWTR